MTGFPVGGGAELVIRIVCEWLERRLGQAFVVENRTYAAARSATEAVVRAQADGYTLLATTTSNLLNGALHPHLRHGFIHDITPVAGVSVETLVLECGPGIPDKTLEQFIADARSRPGKLNVGNFGNRTISHLAAEMLKLEAGIDFLTVPYQGSAPMLTDLRGGRLDAAIGDLSASIDLIRSGSIRALAVTTSTRSEVLPATPALAEAVPGYEAHATAGFAAPAGTPGNIVARLNAEINAVLAEPALREELSGMGVTTLPGTPAEFAGRTALEIEKWSRVIQLAGVKPG